MTPPSELSISAVNKKRQETGAMSPSDPASPHPAGSSQEFSIPQTGVRLPVESSLAVLQDQPVEKGEGFMLPFDPWRAADALWKSRWLALLCGSIFAIGLFFAARKLVEPHYIATAQLVRQGIPDTFRASQTGETYKPNEIPIPVLTSSIMRSRSLMERVGKLTTPEMDPRTILSGMDVVTDRKTEVIRASFTSAISPARAVAIVNNFADEVVKLTKELQAEDASQVNDFLKQQLTRCDIDLDRVNEEMLRYAKLSDLLDGDKEMDAYLSERANFDLKYEAMRLDHETLDLKIQSVERELAKVSPIAAKLQKAREELTQLLTRYTEQNPVVEEQQDRIKNLEAELKRDDVPHEAAPPQAGENPIAGSLYLQRIELLTQKDVLGQQMKKLEAVREKITEKLNQLPRKNLEYALIKAKRQSLDATRQLLASRQREAQLFMDNSLGYYRVLQHARVEDAVSDTRHSKKLIYSAAGFALGFGLIAALFIIRELADGRVKTPADLRRVTRLPVFAALPAEASQDPVARDAWAFRTWTRLQSKLKQPDSALICGLLAETDTESCSTMATLLADAAAWREAAVLVVTNRPPADRATMPLTDAVGHAMTDADKWLASGSGVVFLHADETWKWTPEQRALLDNALGIWARHKHSIVFIELPPASQPEALLMAERLPQILWVGPSGQKPGTALAETLATYRHAGCKLLGALLNQSPKLKPAMLNHYAGTAAVALMLSMALNALAEDAPPPPLAKYDEVAKLMDKPPVASSGKTKGLTLGPGDMVNISMFGRPEMSRKEISLKPDGRLTYLQARDVLAAGLTVDELREKLNSELGKFYNHPSVIVTPFQFQSRKVYLLGKVVKKGMVNLDRPLTLLEAITEAGGLETGLFQQNTVELADLGHSFLSRRGERMKVDFEALFARGDMSQNIKLEPDDYIYFPSANNNEVYVVGNVRSQGTQGLLAQSSVTSVIALAGGFTTPAYRDRVLVIRGALDKPKTFVVNMNAILTGREKGFKLEPNDIIYIADKPWARAEELLDMAITTFLQGAVSGYTSSHVGPLIKRPLISPAQ